MDWEYSANYNVSGYPELFYVILMRPEVVGFLESFGDYVKVGDYLSGQSKDSKHCGQLGEVSVIVKV